MGPVEGAPADAGAATAAAGAPASSAGGGDRKRSDGPAPKRLYLIHEGAMVAGVCNGIAAYFNIDATIVRIVFTGLALLTKGFWILAYFVLAFIIPSATTSEERAAAQGLPFNAQEVIDRAKRNYSDFANKNWGRQWRRQRREMRHRMRSMGRDWSRHEWWHHDWWPAPQPASPANYVARVAAGFMVPVLSFVNAVVFAVLLFGVASLVTTHEVFGETLPSDMPLWVGVGGIVVAYMIIAWPLHAARRASYWTVAGPHHGAVAAWDNLMSLGFAVLLTWFAYHYLAEVREVVDQIPAVWESFRRSQI
jgi:phage shock protein PspC (stress-responsive transcriptional regulator)